MLWDKQKEINPGILKDKEKSLKEINPGIFEETKKLLRELAREISKKFWIDEELAIKLIESETSYNLELLKQEVKKEDITDKEIEELLLTIKWAKELISKNSKEKVSILRWEIESLNNTSIFRNKKLFPDNMLQKATSPANVHEHILWIALWSTKTIFSTTEALYKIWAWIVKSPYHIYLIISWKWEYDWFKNI